MPDLDFISTQEEKAKKGVSLVTFIAVALFVISLGAAGFVGLRYWQNLDKEDQKLALLSGQRSNSYLEAKAFQSVADDVDSLVKDNLTMGTILSEIYDNTIDGVVFEAVTYSASRNDKGGEVKLKGIFSDLELIDEQVRKFQQIESSPIVTYTFEGDNTGKNVTMNAQTAVIFLEY